MRRRPALVLLLLLFLVAGVELGARVVASRLPLDTRPLPALYEEQSRGVDRLLADSTSILLLDAQLGWRHRPGYRDTLRQINAAGIRASREFTPAPPAGVTRIAAFGDANTYSPEVRDAAAWPSVLEARLAGSEVLNFGVGGYGTDQALLRYLREGVAFAPRLAILGVAPINLRRAVTVYPRFASSDEAPLTKPRFRLGADGGLVLLPDPLPGRAGKERLRDEPTLARSLGTHDAWYDAWRYEHPRLDRSAAVRLVRTVARRIGQRYLAAERLYDGDGIYRTGTEAFAVQRALLLAFADSAREHGSVPVVVWLPELEAVTRAREGRVPSYGPLRDALRADGRVAVLDVADAFRAAALPTGGTGAWFAPHGHYSEAGNALVGAWLAERLPSLLAAPQP